METSKKPSWIQSWCVAIDRSELLEAPAQNFIGHRDILTSSIARYRFVAPRLHGIVLEVGCGRGYGFQEIQPWCPVRFGTDISFEFLTEGHAAMPKVPLVESTGEALPFADGSFDSLIAFEVIEHIRDDRSFLSELKRVSHGDGVFAISTPNRSISSGNAQTPLNRFHVREYNWSEFYDLLSQFFPSVQLFGQHTGFGRRDRRPGWVDRIPIRWKYLLPPHIQSLISVAVRPPLSLEDCHFETHNLDNAHTFVALCSL